MIPQVSPLGEAGAVADCTHRAVLSYSDKLQAAARCTTTGSRVNRTSPGYTTLGCVRFFFVSHTKELWMAYSRDYVRKGKPLMFQFDPDAVAMLYEIAPTKKAVGRYLSELVRRDYIRRQEWQQGRAMEAETLEGVGACDE